MGSQTSALMSESAEGAIVRNTRQNARGAKNGVVFEETVRASVTVASCASFRPRRRAHVPEADRSLDAARSATRVAPAAAEKTRRRTATTTRRTSIGLLCDSGGVERYRL